MKHAIVSGATGMVGGHLVRQLAARPDIETTALVRRTGVFAGVARAREVVFDFQDPRSLERIGTELPCDVFFCALGTTIAKAGSQEAFLKVDRDLPAGFVRRLRELEPRPVFALVSAVGASASSTFYLRVKAEVEANAIESGLPCVIARPSLLLGERGELRPMERFAMILTGPLTPAARALGGRGWGTLGRYLPIESSHVARALIAAALDSSESPRGRILEGWDLHPASA